MGLLLVFSHLIQRIRAQPGVLLGVAAGLGFGISDVAIKALAGDLARGPIGILSSWSVIIVTAAAFSFFASARGLQIGDGVAVIAVTAVAANLATILAGLAVFGDRLGHDALIVGVRLGAFALILIGTALIPAPVRAGEALEESGVEHVSGGAERSRDRAPARPSAGEREQPPGENGRHPAEGPPAPREVLERRRARGGLARDRRRSIGPRDRPGAGPLTHDDRA